LEELTVSVRTDFPHRVSVVDNTWITLQDGTRLGARLWLPEGCELAPVPAILEYLPYRKDDAMARRDARQYGYFAGFGYACVRVDIRGTGVSDGILCDEYLAQEQDDALEVLAWIAAQPWCSGQVGMIGISWSGFNGLQIAARRPPELKAVITLCSTDDRYADDVHYMGGCMLAYDMLPWASNMFAYNALPPDPQVVGDRWREMWLNRLENTPPYVEAWVSHQRRDEFWKHGSVCEGYQAIACPVYAVGGWADGYTNAVMRLLEGLSVPRKGLIGPWSHSFPWDAEPGPSIGFLQECLRWWDHWLKGRDTGIMDEPMLRVWMQDSVLPATYYALRPGRWVAEPAWPSSNVAAQRLYLSSDSQLAEAHHSDARLDHAGSLLAGMASGVWCPYGAAGELPADQRGDDGRSLIFDSRPAAEPIEILGYPQVELDVSVDQPVALLAARLCDVAPDGASTLVTYGMLNLTHRDGHELPQPVEPGQRYGIRLRLNAAAYRLPAGHRWRLALSQDYWPIAWPSPAPAKLSVFASEASHLALPVRSPQDADDSLPTFGPAEHAPPPAVDVTRTGRRDRTWQWNTATGQLLLTSVADDGGVRFASSGIELDARLVDTYDIVEGQPLSARVRSQWQLAYGRGDWRISIKTDSLMTSDARNYHLTNTLDAYEGSVRVFARTWHKSIPRDYT
jgi:uncharacterized protein